jgi:hypothetical protein
MKRFWVIRNAKGEYWQTAKNFVSADIRDATKYRTRQEAMGARGFVVSNRVASEVVEVDQ